jgi:ribonuclease-3
MKQIEENIGYVFQNKSLLIEALTHPSVKRLARNNLSYERLEFLGDKVLGLIIAEALIQHFPSENEGELSKRLASLVCKQSLAEIGHSLRLGEFLILSRGQSIDGGRDNINIIENTMEAIIGAIFLDGGMQNAKEFVLRHFKHSLENLDNIKAPQDPKSAFQEWFQKKYKKIPEYNLESSENFYFTVSLKFEGLAFYGKAKSIKEAEKLAALEALMKFTT